MRAVHLDFVARPPRPLLAWVVLAAGALLLAQAADHYADMEDEVARLDTQVSRLQRQTKTAATPTGKAEQNARNQSQQREQALLAEASKNTWLPPLQALEGARDEDVAVLTLNQEGSAHRLRISGEARSIEDTLAFMDRLRSSGQFSEVMLSGHENKKSTGVDVLGFTLMATWE